MKKLNQEVVNSHSSKAIEYNSEEGITIGLIDSLMTIAEVLNKRLEPQNSKEVAFWKEPSEPVKEALKDYYDNRAIKSIFVKAFKATGQKIEIWKQQKKFFQMLK